VAEAAVDARPDNVDARTTLIKALSQEELRAPDAQLDRGAVADYELLLGPD
jgi:hypothetical protein